MKYPPFYFLFSKFLFVILLLSIFYLLFSITSVYAAEMFFEPINKEVSVNQQFQVDLVLDTENKSINAFEGEVIFPSELLELKEIKDGNSIVNFWVERPSVTRQTDTIIVFSGITPGGFSGEKGLIFSMIFQTKTEGGGTIKVQEAKTLLNDGFGTLAQLSISDFQFSIFKEVPTQPLMPEIKDINPPELFAPKITRDSNIFDGKWFTAFATQDKLSGINYYKIKESRYKILNIFQRWIIAESPYILTDQKLRSFIYIKAVDNAGNERIATIEPKYPLQWYEKWELWSIIIVIIIFLYFGKRILWKKVNLEFRK